MEPVAQLQTINLQALKRGCADEVSKLLGAVEQNGIFYLDLNDEVPLDGVTDEINRLSRRLFGLSAEEKMRFDVDELGPFKLNGYKPVGRNVGGLPGQRDGFESYAISSNPDSPAPQVVAQFRPELAEFQSICLDLAQVLVESLSVACGVPKESSFQACHSTPAGPSDPAGRLVHVILQIIQQAVSTIYCGSGEWDCGTVAISPMMQPI